MSPTTLEPSLAGMTVATPLELNHWSHVGFFGGTFDPPHAGHTRVIEAAIAGLNLSELLVVPANQNPLKLESGTAYEDRLAMSRKHFAGMERVTVSDMERNRKPSYTYVSIDDMFLEARGPANYHVIIGDDCASDLARWYKCIDMVVLADIYIVGPRANEKRASLPPWLRRHVGTITLDTPVDHATQVRESLSRGVRHEMLSDDVYQYIQERGLYQ